MIRARTSLKKNRNINELTALYWAWKNYDKLGNPDYIGLMHYRRQFSKEALSAYQKYDIIAYNESFSHTLKKQFISAHSEKPYTLFC